MKVSPVKHCRAKWANSGDALLENTDMLFAYSKRVRMRCELGDAHPATVATFQ
jgi:hypothetical protein